MSTHTSDSLRKTLDESSGGNINIAKSLTRRVSQVFAHKEEKDKQAAIMKTAPTGLYERFRRGLLEYHSEVCS